MVSLRASLVATLIAVLAAASTATLRFATGSKQVEMVSFGDGLAHFYVVSDGGPTDDVSVSTSDLYSVGGITNSPAHGGGTNYTVPLELDNGVGTDDVVITIGGESIAGEIVAAGFVILMDGDVVSGEGGAGVSVGQTGTKSFDVQAVGKDGTSVDISGTKISSDSGYMEVDMSGTSISSSKLTIAINPYRVGSGSFTLSFDTDAIVVDGESFETSLKVSQVTSPPPPCVAVGGTATVSNGQVIVSMYNLLSPPQATAISTVTISVGSESADWDMSSSTLGKPDQEVVFDFSTNGVASITCDGKPAYMQGGDLTIAGGGSSSYKLAKDSVSDLPTAGDGFLVFTATFRMLDSSRDEFPASTLEKMLKKMCSVIGAEDCVCTSVEDGSAITDLSATVPEDSDAKSKIEDAAGQDSCEFQGEADYGDKCDQMLLINTGVLAVNGGAVAASAGLATWTIVLIAGLGAFALIALIMLGLLAVYRRSAEQSESDYSSSGPLGVPDPSDLLYEQSIVRDIYGRGDFPEGGPTAEVAQQRAREADLREEFPRPPSSSGLSRGSATDDASSTYSV